MGLLGLSCLQNMESLFRHAGSFIEVHILSLVAVLTLRHVGSEFPDQGSNPRPLHCKVNSQPLHHQGSPQGAPSIPSSLLRVSPPTSSSPRPGLGDSENWILNASTLTFQKLWLEARSRPHSIAASVDWNCLVPYQAPCPPSLVGRGPLSPQGAVSSLALVSPHLAMITLRL